MAYPGNNGVATMSMGVGLTVVIALFIDAGTVTADFNRWAADRKSSLISTFSAFPFANLVAMLVGGVMTAALAVPNANPFGVDNMFGYMNGKQLTWLSALAFLFLYCNLGSVCSHCLYNAATGWSRILRSHMRLFAVILGVIGIVIAAGNVWAFFIQWLSLLGILVPPIGAVILVDQYVLRPNASIDRDWRSSAFIAWAAGSIVACGFLTPATPAAIALTLLFVAGLSRSMQFTALNTIGFADITPAQRSSASTLSSMLQQISMLLGVAIAAAILNLAGLIRAGIDEPLADFRWAFAVTGLIGMAASLRFLALPPDAGAEVSGHRQKR